MRKLVKMTDLKSASPTDRFKASIKKLMSSPTENKSKIDVLLIAMTMVDDRKATRSQTYREAVNITYEVLGD